MTNNLETATLEEKKEKKILEVPSYKKGKRNFSMSPDFFKNVNLKENSNIHRSFYIALKNYVVN